MTDPTASCACRRLGLLQSTALLDVLAVLSKALKAPLANAIFDGTTLPLEVHLAKCGGSLHVTP
eukprot:m.181179 g.181179  ORF g.181179 m.181179 type:complete len:64 (-) comp14959_c0_seq7:53-244(-)